MKFTVLTLFPDFFSSFFDYGVIGRAFKNRIIFGQSIDIRDYAVDTHKTVDDKPYGGGCGMVMKPEILDSAIASTKEQYPGSKVLFMTPKGIPFDQKKAQDMALKKEDLIFVCGRYEGIDERVVQKHVDEEVSMGDFVMTGGEVAAMAIIDSVARLLPGVLGGETSAELDSFSNDRLEHDQYTRPYEFEQETVPDVLLSGNHRMIEEWRRHSSVITTFIKRPDLFKAKGPDEEEKKILKELCQELEEIIGR
ncbi:MAG: tRNA (guanosine(37)-N1)-methyltransferase TrmD [Desulfobacteraceae bacterium]|nr:tRNA (guanosine(37)-N1)-methyltransferase TrmD [Desulfobacteraceae bacterium]